MTKPISAGTIVFRQFEQNPIEYLLLQAGDGEDYWTPPKGHLEEDETSLQAAQRETKEEAGLDKLDLKYYNKFEEMITYDAYGRPKTVCYYLARLINIEKNIIISNEHQNSIWLNLQKACHLINHIQTSSALQKAEEFLLNTQQESDIY